MSQSLEDILSQLDEPPAFYRTENVKISKDIHFYIGTRVSDPEDYFPMIHEIETASANDTIYMHLNTTGGNLATGVQIISAMRESVANIICSIEGECHSLGTLIGLSGDELVVSPLAIVMFHNWSGGSTGKGNEQMAEIVATNKWFRKLAREIYVPFLSHEEVERILKGEDIWMDAEEINRRLSAMLDDDEIDDKSSPIGEPGKFDDWENESPNEREWISDSAV
jgi:ATP-dependent Clp protease protease subunit